MRIWIRDEDQQLLHYALGNHHMPRLDDLTQCIVEGHPEFIVTGQLVGGEQLHTLAEDFTIGEAKYWGPPPLNEKTPVVQFRGERKFMLSPYLDQRYRSSLTPTRHDRIAQHLRELHGDITPDFMSRIFRDYFSSLVPKRRGVDHHLCAYSNIDSFLPTQ